MAQSGDTAREATSDEVKELKAEARQVKETLAEVLIENRLLKKSVLGDGENAFMRYSASEKLEIIELVEQSTLSVGRTLASMGSAAERRAQSSPPSHQAPCRGASARPPRRLPASLTVCAADVQR